MGIPTRTRWGHGALAAAVVCSVLAAGTMAVSTAGTGLQGASLPVFTPYDTSPWMFRSMEEAARALESPDIQIRRSGVRWLARWTAVDGANWLPDLQSHRAAVAGLKSVRPALIQAVYETPDRDSRLAARLLALSGPAARSAIPAVCAALRRPGYVQDFVGRNELVVCLLHLSGGPDRIAGALKELLRNRDATTRLAVAFATRYCTTVAFPHSDRPEGAYPLSDADEDAWRSRFLIDVLPAMAGRLGDSNADVRLAAAESLDALTYYPDRSAWAPTLGPLARAATSSDEKLRNAALRAIEHVPADVSVIVRSLRNALALGGAERRYALTALGRGARTDRLRTLKAFTGDLRSPTAARRRLASADLAGAATVLWSGGFWPDSDPDSEWTSDSRAFFDPLTYGRTAQDRETVERRRAADSRTAQGQLLSALVKAAQGGDRDIRANAVASLLKIGHWLDAVMGSGGAFREGERVFGEVTGALTEAAASLQSSDPTAAAALRDLVSRIQAPHARI